jgi:stage V sporulation protein AC
MKYLFTIRWKGVFYMANDNKKVTAGDVIKEKDQTAKEEKYNQYVKEITPTHNKITNFFKAYVVGGIICVIGQGINNLYLHWGLTEEIASGYTSLSLIFLSVLLTGLNIYPKLAKFGGAGTVVPITGFANSVAAPAVEFKKEGQVFGIGCKIFTIAGPVILYGIFSSWVLGVIYFILLKMGIVS